jgi:hypothetical protein
LHHGFLNSLFGRTIPSFLIFLGVSSCEQYEYTSPLPGVIEVRLRVVNNRQDLIPFGAGNVFSVTLRNLEVRTPTRAELPIYSNVRAIRRNPDGDVFNCLDTLARDSSIILGEAFAPPGVFSSLEVEMVPAPSLLFWNGYFSTSVNVVTSQQQTAAHLLFNHIPVEQDRHTRVTVTFDLDSSLVRREEDFEYRPRFYISSVQIF